jgi:hypothetical protein
MEIAAFVLYPARLEGNMGRNGLAMQAESSVRCRPSEKGFALVLAILSLMLLTFLGLTLALTTSTELQIATNYRWSRQAFYNAEAGIEAAKVLLANSPSWVNLLPPQRTGPQQWAPTVLPALPTQPVWPTAGRDFESRGCDRRGGEGYGVVLNGTLPTGAAFRAENVSTFLGQPLNGAFTLWVRRDLQLGTPAGTLQDDGTNPPTTLVLTAEGVAPYTAVGGAATAFAKANQARQLLEVSLTLGQGNVCKQFGGQRGAAPSGENFDPCSVLAAGAGGSLAGAFGNQAGRVGGVGDLASTGAK